jgi:hypothetical protein
MEKPRVRAPAGYDSNRTSPVSMVEIAAPRLNALSSGAAALEALPPHKEELDFLQENADLPSPAVVFSAGLSYLQLTDAWSAEERTAVEVDQSLEVVLSLEHYQDAGSEQTHAVARGHILQPSGTDWCWAWGFRVGWGLLI